MSNPTMFTYIKSEQAAMLKILDNYPTETDKALIDAPIESAHWLVLATGSSINAAQSAKYYIEKMAKVQFDIKQPYNYSHYDQIDPTIDFVLGISQSGQSTSTIEALTKVKNDHLVHSIAVTSMPGTEITQVANTTLDIQIGHEQVGYVSLGFTATVLNLMLLGLRVGVKKGLVSKAQEQQEITEFKTIALKFNDTIDQTTHFFENNRDDLKNAYQFTSIAYGPSVGTADEMQTKFTEVIRVPSQGHELEAYMHGPYLAVNDQHRIFFIETDSSDAIVNKEIALKNYEQRYTKHVFAINFRDDHPESQDHTLNLIPIKDEFKVPFIGVLPFQVLAWLITTERGVDLSKQIFTDFSDVVHNKTEHQNYV